MLTVTVQGWRISAPTNIWVEPGRLGRFEPRRGGRGGNWWKRGEGTPWRRDWGGFGHQGEVHLICWEVIRFEHFIDLPGLASTYRLQQCSHACRRTTCSYWSQSSRRWGEKILSWLKNTFRPRRQIIVKSEMKNIQEKTEKVCRVWEKPTVQRKAVGQ